MARRQRRRRAISGAATSSKTKAPFPINLIWNAKALYASFIVVMILSLAAVGLSPGLGSTSQRQGAAPIDEDGGPTGEQTPSAAAIEPAPGPVLDLSTEQEAVIATDQGEIVITLNADAPDAANNFAYLASLNFYDGLEFFWVLPGFDAQAGDPTCEAAGQYTCSGGGGPGYTLPVDGPSDTMDVWAVVAPVTTPGGDQIHGSQFVIALTEGLEFEGSVIGRVIDGRDILESLPERTPCFTAEPSESNPCTPEEQLPPPLIIEDVRVRPAA